MEYIKQWSKDSEKSIIAGGLERNNKSCRKTDTEASFLFILLSSFRFRAVWFRDCIIWPQQTLSFWSEDQERETLEPKRVVDILSFIVGSQICLCLGHKLDPKLQPCGVKLVAKTRIPYLPWRKPYLQEIFNSVGNVKTCLSGQRKRRVGTDSKVRKL